MTPEEQKQKQKYIEDFDFRHKDFIEHPENYIFDDYSSPTMNERKHIKTKKPAVKCACKKK